MKIILFISLYFLAFGFSSYVSAENQFPNPLFQIEKIVNKTFVVEHMYPYTAQYYKQPLKLKNIKKSEANYDTPENALISLLSAMKSLNIDWALSNWDKASSKKLQGELDSKDIIKKALKGWKRIYSEADFFLLKRVDRQDGNFVILEYKVKPPLQDEFKDTYNFRREHGKWKATHKFSNDWVSNYLPSNKVRIQVPGD